MKNKNVFCRVEFLNGRTQIYQFPNDLRSAMIEEGLPNVRKLMKGSLINVPVSKSRYDGKVDLSVAKVKQVFAMRKVYPPHLRTRGQFISASSLNSKSSLNFLLHDHSFINKLRIRFDCARWKIKLAKDEKGS